MKNELDYFERKKYEHKILPNGIIVSIDDYGQVKIAMELELGGGRNCELYKLCNLEEVKKALPDSGTVNDFNEECLLSGPSLVYVTIPDLDIELTFREIDEVVLVYSLSDHFYDETEEMDAFDDYLQYLNSREGLLYAVHECRNKYWNGCG